MVCIECSLCKNELPKNPIIDGVAYFCCAGCHAVFNILASSNQLDDFENHPVFTQAVRSGLVSNPLLLDQIRARKIEAPLCERDKLYLEVADMWCPACAEIIRLIVLQKNGVHSCVIDYSTDLAAIEFSPRCISKEEIIQAIQSFGYTPVPWQHADTKVVSSSLYLRFIVAAFCSLNVMMFAYPLYATYFDIDGQEYGQLFVWLSLLFSLPVVFYSAWPIIKRFLASFQTGLFGMETLVLMGIITAGGLSIYEMWQGGTRVYFDTMTVIIAFVLLGKIIEAKAKFSAKDALFRLMRSVPRRGRKKLLDGSTNFVSIKEISVGDVIEVLSGEKIVLDGVVVEGVATCDESLMTGEAIPVNKNIGDTVLAGSILNRGTIAFRVVAAADESLLNKIVEMVQKDIAHKSAYVRAADRIVRWFVPAVVVIAFFTWVVCYGFGFSDPFIRAVSVLLISCPCSIGIAAPLAESHLMSGLAALGVIVRNRGCLDMLGKETVYVFDKTGTVTEGKFTILDGLENLSEKELAILKAMTAKSLHPISQAITQAIIAGAIAVECVEEIVGKGLRSFFEGSSYLLGSSQFMRQQGVSFTEQQGVCTTVYFACDAKELTSLSLGDRIRAEVQQVLKALPVQKILLSGDGEDVVASVAKYCGFDTFVSQCNPLQKRNMIESLRRQGHIVTMIGDGINDAPALTAANIGISVVCATDISIQVSDLLLTTEKLSILPQMRMLAKKGHRIIRQNLFWAFFYNVVGIVMAMFGLLSPIFAAAAMVISSLLVVFNARRL